MLVRLSRDRNARWLFFTAIAALAALPYLRTAGAFNEFRDAQVMWLYEDSARRSVLDFAQFPLWNPDYCGGLPALGTPQSRFAAPTFLLTLLFGTTRAEPLTLFAMVLLAIFGTWKLARDHGASQLGATLAAPLFGLMGTFACAPFLGWLAFLGFALLPWVLYGLRRAARGDARGVAIVALSTAFIVGFGGTYVAPISLVACVLELLVLVARRKRLDLKTLTFATLITVGLSAFRLWPVWEELQRGPRVISGMSNYGVQAIGGSLFGAHPLWTTESWYLVTIPAVVVAAFALLRRRAWWLGGMLAIWLWLAAGNAANPSLYAALRSLPVFSLLRASDRFLVPAVLTLALGAALAITDAAARLRLKKRPRLARPLWGLSLLGLALALPWQLHNFDIAASKRTLTAPPREITRPFHQARGNRWAAASFGPASRGSLACWEAYGVPQSAKLRADAAHEAWLSDPQAGALEERRWSPQSLSFHVKADRPTRLVVNQNYHRGWKSDVGEVRNEEGLLAVELPAGEHELTLRFLPTSALGGLATSILALVTALAWTRRAWTLPQRLGLACAPLLMGALIAVTSSEPPAPSATPLSPEGEPLLVDAPPPGTTTQKVRFAGDVVLEASSVTLKDDHVRVEVDWSRGSAINPRLGFFVHIEPGTLKRITADHLQVSDTYFLEQLPIGKLGRDVMTIDIPAEKRGQQWNVWVGLWEMRGNGDRVPIVDANGAKVGDNRVLVGSVDVQP